MNPEQQALHARRASLLLRSQGLRSTLGQQLRALRPVGVWADRSRAALRWVQRNPQWLVGGVVLFAIVRPRGALTWGARILGAWQLWRRVRPLWEAPVVRRS